jgi:hypothetical protein
MEAKGINERELVQQCMKSLAAKAGFANPATMVQRDVEFLSERIESVTGILISLSTLKRLFNGQFSRQPQIATLNAMAQFNGYKHWQDYKLSVIPGNMISNNEFLEKAPTVLSTTTHRFPRAKFLLVAGILIIAALGLLAMFTRNKNVAGNFDKAVFTFSKTTSNDLPNTVVFNYNIDDVNADSFFIQQSWDKNRRARIFKKNYTLTDIYFEPGYHVAKLIANDRVIKTIDVSIPTDRWFFYAKAKAAGALPLYITPSSGFENGSLLLQKSDLGRRGIITTKEQQYAHVYFPSDITYDSDNFEFNYRIRVHELNNVNCPYLMSEVFCQRNFMYFISMPRGCASEMKAQFSDKLLNGKTIDLSALGYDIFQWQDVRLRVENKVATIFFNNEKVFSSAYEESGGLITGLGFISNGLCEIDRVELKNLAGKIIYANNFDSTAGHSP